ncbi:BTB/POZ fold [Penicillium roqueforti FM164]|uniref:BTB/POZ fold n=1 Tax=Penicillium roqueforti (strain FM164) TaxID=1365484 RepID=W6QW77_PENRF|nr:BTB/POZ fold [Penicillium roqueforti FM164]
MESKKAIQFPEFLGSDTVSLCTTSSSESWKIHRKLLVSKCKALESAFSHDFPERSSGQYIFNQTTHDTVARFIEWAYRDDYTELDLTPMEVNQRSRPRSEPSGPAKPSEDDHLQAHTLLCHLRVYIFSDTYLVDDLKNVAFEKFTTVVKDVGNPQNLNEQLAIIDCLLLAFSTLPPHDKLLEWLARYAAWCLSSLRLQVKFHELLQKIPALSYRMMETLSPAKEPPWNIKLSKYRVPSYDARTGEDFAYED